MTFWGIINTNKRNFIRDNQKIEYNSVKINHGNTLEHELMKCEISYKLRKNGHTFLTEAILKNGDRPDIIVMDISPPIAYEVMKSETDKSIEVKRNSYGMEIREVRI